MDKYENLRSYHNETAILSINIKAEQQSPKSLDLTHSSRMSRSPRMSKPLNQEFQNQNYDAQDSNSLEHHTLVDGDQPAIQINTNSLKIPSFSIYVPRSKSIPNLFNSVQIQSKRQNYFCVSKSPAQLILLKQLPYSLKERVTNIMCSEQNQYFIRSKNCIIIVKYDSTSEILSGSAVSGDIGINQQMILILTTTIQDSADGVDQFASSNQRNDFDMHDLDQDIYQNPYYLDAASVALIYKYVKDPDVQKKIQNVMKMICTNLRSFNASTNKKILEKEIIKIGILAMSLHEEIILLQNHNLTRVQNQPLFPYYRLALEKYLYEQVHSLINPIYVSKYQQKENQFILKRQHNIDKKDVRDQIIKQMNPRQIMKYLDIKDKFTTLTQRQIEVYEGNIDEQVDPPYKKAIDELSRINLMLNPREKLKCIQLMLCMMKSDAVEYNNNKEELTAMDDELPIIIYIVLNARFQNQYAEIQYIEDFTNTDQSIENERRSITNILVSLDYIANEWEIQTQT